LDAISQFIIKISFGRGGARIFNLLGAKNISVTMGTVPGSVFVRKQVAMARFVLFCIRRATRPERLIAELSDRGKTGRKKVAFLDYRPTLSVEGVGTKSMKRRTAPANCIIYACANMSRL
jgi:hypothetical protein